ncbi:helix-turn-helix domain-containing protein [Micromonospora globbae]|uniref:Helix-turn-helix domain-containing protein n=1 Tax=Micromonospora globbae TaxID=1894969 RepID=A0ABZ1S4Y3_9ACTN|nr:helix-turn-helix domain-containing protein [Micromonospora globbae]
MARTTGTKAQRDHVRQTLAGFGATPAAIAGELQRRFGLRPRDAFRQAHGWTQEAVAERLNNSGNGSASFTGARISDYERWPFGGRRPTLAALNALAQLFGTEPNCLVDLDDLAAMPESDRRILGSANTSSLSNRPTAAQPVPPSNNMTEPLRWDLGALLDETELVITVAERTASFGAWAQASNVGPFTLDDIAASTRRIALDYLTEPPVVVYARAGLLADRVFQLLQTGRQNLDQARELYTWAGYLCALLGWMAGDLGHPAAAESQARTAWMCAEMVRDNTLRAWVLSTISKIHLWERRFDEAANAAARGFSHAVEGTAAVMLACQEADAWAEIGAAEPARQALRRAEEARQNAGNDSVGGLLACGVVRQHNYAGAVLLRIGEAASAIEHADHALAEAAADPSVAYGTLAQIRIWAASAHLNANSLDGAISMLSPVLTLPPEQRLDPLVHRLRDLGRTIASTPSLRASTEARRIQAAITDFCATGAARQLP